MHVLVAVASRHGSTRQIADAIALELRGRDIDAEVQPVADVRNVAGYDAVVLGSAIYLGNWEWVAQHFALRNQAALQAMPVWLFSSGPVDAKQLTQADPPRVVELVQLTRARAHQLFAGKLDRHALNLGERLLANVVHAAEGDFRDWKAIRAWADEIAVGLTPRRGGRRDVASDTTRQVVTAA